ncbi:hypothetical protein B0J11DRAFT_533309 [Dendryphion nanum]|uniref:Uncharacterized protein n=1 Tax=Dendryphion nanum TaxID=256645 RepID=A0A9P9DI64_9PLEO|nr:hypothetical protein B0J11DRAFT_533309 [Dendryphion nanum]
MGNLLPLQPNFALQYHHEPFRISFPTIHFLGMTRVYTYVLLFFIFLNVAPLNPKLIKTGIVSAEPVPDFALLPRDFGAISDYEVISVTDAGDEDIVYLGKRATKEKDCRDGDSAKDKIKKQWKKLKDKLKKLLKKIKDPPYIYITVGVTVVIVISCTFNCRRLRKIKRKKKKQKEQQHHFHPGYHPSHDPYPPYDY